MEIINCVRLVISFVIWFTVLVSICFAGILL